MLTVPKPSIMLEGPKDWDDWYEVVRTAAHARGISSLIDVDAEPLPQQLTMPMRPRYQHVRAGVTSYAELEPEEKDHFKVLMSEYRIRMERYEKQQKALIDILDLIQATIGRNLRAYIYGKSTPVEILKALKRPLGSTDRVRRLELAREYEALQKAPRGGQHLERWLMHWETTCAEAEKLNLAEVQDNKALYDFILAIKGVDPAYASAYQVHVDNKFEEDPTAVPTLTDAVERFRNNLRFLQATSRPSSHLTALTAFQDGKNDREAESLPESP